jgi:hypothetical protein
VRVLGSKVAVVARTLSRGPGCVVASPVPASLGFYASEAYVASLVERFNESQRACIDASLRNEGRSWK